MRMIKINIALTSLFIGLAASGCATEEQEPAATTEAVRGITSYDVENSATLTSVIGRDADGKEVMRLDLTHGLFPVTDDIRENFKHDTEIVGRRFDVYLEGRDAWFWAVKGLEAGWMHLPGPNGGDPRLRAFLQEPHVKAAFDQWHLGFDMPVTANGQEKEYGANGTASGTGGTACTGSNCGTPRSGEPTAYSCGGDATHLASVIQGWKVTQTNVPAGGVNVNQWLIAQYCPSTSPPTAPKGWVWVSTKTCPIATTVAGNGTNGCPTGTYVSTCGCADQGATGDACVGCPGGAQRADYYGSATGTSTQLTYGYWALTDQVGSWWGVTGGVAGPQTFFLGSATTVTMNNGAPQYKVGMNMTPTWTNGTNCTGTGTTATCIQKAGDPNGGITATSPSSGHVINFQSIGH